MTHVWQPVKGETIIRCDCGECSRSVYVNDGVIEIFDDTDGEELTAHLPDEYALCRRAASGPAAQGAGVPVEIADILRPLVNEVHWARYGSEDDEQRAALVRYWLDSQRPAPGQE